MPSPVLSEPRVDIESLPGVSLEELNARASLLSRTDRKYVVAVDRLDGVLDRVDGARALEVDGRRSFGYESVYFDTPELDSYHRTATRRRLRFKVRTRRYDDSGRCWLEVKTRGARGVTHKMRIPHAADDHGHLAPEGRVFVAECLAGAGLDPSAAMVLTPVVTISYTRSTLLLPSEAGRVTIDRDLRVSSADGTSPALGADLIAETKSAGGPTSVDRLLWGAGIRPSVMSKFGVAMLHTRPDLPNRKWHRAITHHFPRPEETP